MTERHLTITRYTRHNNPTEPAVFAKYVDVPDLRLRGFWLLDAGFAFGERVRIEVGKGVLVVTVDLAR